MVILEGSQPSAISYLMREAIRCHQRCHPRCHEDLLEGPQPLAVSYPDTCISPSVAEITISFVSASGIVRAISCSRTQRASRSTSAARIVVVGSALNHAPATDCSGHSEALSAHHPSSAVVQSEVIRAHQERNHLLERGDAPNESRLRKRRAPPTLLVRVLGSVVREANAHVGEAVIRMVLGGAEGTDRSAVLPYALQALAVLGIVLRGAQAMRADE
jgi:hypothetical protein